MTTVDDVITAMLLGAVFMWILQNLLWPYVKSKIISKNLTDN